MLPNVHFFECAHWNMDEDDVGEKMAALLLFEDGGAPAPAAAEAGAKSESKDAELSELVFAATACSEVTEIVASGSVPDASSELGPRGGCCGFGDAPEVKATSEARDPRVFPW